MNADLLDTANEPPDPNDRFAYGWRYAPTGRFHGPEAGEFAGEPIREQVPLTLEDVLHPLEEDFHGNGVAHFDDRSYIQQTFGYLLRDRPETVVVSDLRVTWDPAGKVGFGPDVCVLRA